jgi:hypothetical protein
MRGGVPDGKKLGQVLSRYLGRWIDGRRLMAGEVKGTRKWRVEGRREQGPEGVGTHVS